MTSSTSSIEKVIEKEKVKRVVFIDSGAGGLPYLDAFRKRNPKTPLLYIADTKNFPYGGKTKDVLSNILIELTVRIKKFFSPRLVALACNTASVSALDKLRRAFPDTVFVGTVPAVKPALLASSKKHIAVIGTERTMEDGYISRLAEDAGHNCTVSRIAAGELVEFVEHRLDMTRGTDAKSGEGKSLEKAALVKKYIGAVREIGADALVLGCTHFLFLLDEFREAARPDIRVFDSADGVCGRIENLLQDKQTEQSTLENLLLVTGNAGDEWARRAALFGLVPCKPRGWEEA
jgi:glutamate racemase